jgi:general secretion pathway protein C
MHIIAPGRRLADVRQILNGTEEWFAALLTKRWFPVVINLVALVLLTASMARWTWSVLAPAEVPFIPPAATPVQTAPGFDVQTVLSAQLFGAPPMTTDHGSIESLPVSSLNLVLTGVVSAGKGGYALIRVEGQPEAPFAVGDEIVSGAVLRQVYADRVVIDRGGVAESLMLEGPSALPGVSGTAEAPAAPRPSAVAPVTGIRQQAPNNYAVSRDVVNNAMRSPQELLSQSLMVPNNGGGFLVREIQPGSIYEKLGLRVGDVIRSANGQPVNTLEDAVKVYQQSANNNQIRLEVLRNGKPEHLLYTLQ